VCERLNARVSASILARERALIRALREREETAMWKQNWGQMIWGNPAAVPLMGPLGLLLLAMVLMVLGAIVLRNSSARRLLGSAMVLLALLLPMSALAVPFAFINGSVADANQVNQNFASVQSRATCNWLITACSSDLCPVTCPTGTHVEGGGCDLIDGSPLAESRPATTGNFPASPAPISAFNQWICRSADGSTVQGTYAVCCAN
jgi:hypothetical protein